MEEHVGGVDSPEVENLATVHCPFETCTGSSYAKNMKMRFCLHNKVGNFFYTATLIRVIPYLRLKRE
jgi:hypothetical protein